jgi:predicted dehydrogenase
VIRVGIVGAGARGSEAAHHLRQEPGCKVVAVADPDRARALALASEMGAKAHSDYQDFLGQVDAVVIASPNNLRREQAVGVARAGVHLYLESPMATTLEDAQAIAKAVREAGVKCFLGMTERVYSTQRTLIRLAREGSLGEIISIFSRRLVYANPTSVPPWRLDPQRSGGLLYEVHLHELDWMMCVGGEVRSVYARTFDHYGGARPSDHFWVTLGFEGGATAMHEGSWIASSPQFYYAINGTRAGVNTDEWDQRVFVARLGEPRQELPLDPHEELYGRFVRAILEDQSFQMNETWGLKLMTVAEAVLESARRGTVVNLDEGGNLLPEKSARAKISMR